MELRLKELREDLGLSVSDVSNDTGISKSSIRLYEKGGMPSIKQIEVIARIYDVPPAWLIGWVNKREEKMPLVKVIEKVVYREVEGARLPPYHNNDNNGKLIKWKESVRLIPIQK
ncbi:helix-turn-helix domain-containing protein [Streptococcus gordonii]|jgi:Helix-turn-helix.|uniref:helix-turn-helix domain-containing protein n=1 Tax=Streptococcus gordonii TaxID=1302 RepID=UPI001EDD053F|nr:helix-turn-helix transcriptional regulator [Streptococcus gordonii]MCG4822234.1 helix-turn-helix transcriptional regulator [Streptococcus gordonii]MCG4847754.1 helix-turn-helix transcriptional regulator [Streptococcus gordonii]MDE8686163.1 helix-turn-helix transcriptional regulator [Streptococcus gordonii]